MYLFTVFDTLVYDGRPFRAGETIDIGDPLVTIKEVTDDGRPLTVSFQFNRGLEGSAYRWVRWDDGVYAPFEVPEIGESVSLPPVTLPL